MMLKVSPSFRRITITTHGAYLDPLRLTVTAKYWSPRCVVIALATLALVLPMIFVATAVIKLDSIAKCTGPDCKDTWRKLGGHEDASYGLKEDGMAAAVVATLQKGSSAPVEEVPESIEELINQATSLGDDSATIIIKLRAMVEMHEEKARLAKLQRALFRHFASKGVPKGLHCLSLRLTEEYFHDPKASQPLPPPDKVPNLTNHSLHHFVLISDNVLAASVVVASTVANAPEPEKVVFHVVTDETTYGAMRAWFALSPPGKATVEVCGSHQLTWLARSKMPVLELMERSLALQQYYFGDHILEEAANDPPQVLAAKLQARSPKYVSLMNHLRMYLPEVFPDLHRVVFLDDDVVVQADLGPLFALDLAGKISAAVETCGGRGSTPNLVAKQFRSYFNFSHPLIAERFKPETCAWAFGLNVFDLERWRASNVTETYHHWQEQNLKLNMTLWRLGTLPPALIAFYGQVLPLDPTWHLFGLGYQAEATVELVRKAAVIHYNGPAKPWLDMAFLQYRPFWTSYVDYNNELIHQCNIYQTPHE